MGTSYFFTPVCSGARASENRAPCLKPSESRVCPNVSIPDSQPVPNGNVTFRSTCARKNRFPRIPRYRREQANLHPRLAVGDQPRGILSWVANTARSSYYMLNVNGHNLYRLNYPLRLNKWYHSCQSWNGRTGEWQIWVNDERVGRGFNNRVSTILRYLRPCRFVS